MTFLKIIITVILDFVQPSQVHVCVCARARAKHVVSYNLPDCPLQNRLHFEYEHGRPLLRAKSPLASFPLPAPVRASVPLRMRHSTDEKEDYVL